MHVGVHEGWQITINGWRGINKPTCKNISSAAQQFASNVNLKKEAVVLIDYIYLFDKYDDGENRN